MFSTYDRSLMPQIDLRAAKGSTLSAVWAPVQTLALAVTTVLLAAAPVFAADTATSILDAVQSTNRVVDDWERMAASQHLTDRPTDRLPVSVTLKGTGDGSALGNLFIHTGRAYVFDMSTHTDFIADIRPSVDGGPSAMTATVRSGVAMIIEAYRANEGVTAVKVGLIATTNHGFDAVPAPSDPTQMAQSPRFEINAADLGRWFYLRSNKPATLRMGQYDITVEAL